MTFCSVKELNKEKDGKKGKWEVISFGTSQVTVNFTVF